MLVRHGKVRYIGCSNFSGWHIMKALGVSAAEHRQRFVSQQIHYTLEAREAEYELLPVSIDQGLGRARLEPACRRPALRQAPPQQGRRKARGSWPDGDEPPIRDEGPVVGILSIVLVEIAPKAAMFPCAQVCARLADRPQGRHLRHHRAAVRKPSSRTISPAPS